MRCVFWTLHCLRKVCIACVMLRNTCIKPSVACVRLETALWTWIRSKRLLFVYVKHRWYSRLRHWILPSGSLCSRYHFQSFCSMKRWSLVHGIWVMAVMYSEVFCVWLVCGLHMLRSCCTALGSFLTLFVLVF